MPVALEGLGFSPPCSMSPSALNPEALESRCKRKNPRPLPCCHWPLLLIAHLIPTPLG